MSKKRGILFSKTHLRYCKVCIQRSNEIIRYFYLLQCIFYLFHRIFTARFQLPQFRTQRKKTFNNYQILVANLLYNQSYPFMPLSVHLASIYCEMQQTLYSLILIVVFLVSPSKLCKCNNSQNHYCLFSKCLYYIRTVHYSEILFLHLFLAEAPPTSLYSMGEGKSKKIAKSYSKTQELK